MGAEDLSLLTCRTKKGFVGLVAECELTPLGTKGARVLMEQSDSLIQGKVASPNYFIFEEDFKSYISCNHSRTRDKAINEYFECY